MLILTKNPNFSYLLFLNLDDYVLISIRLNNYSKFIIICYYIVRGVQSYINTECVGEDVDL